MHTKSVLTQQIHRNIDNDNNDNYDSNNKGNNKCHRLEHTVLSNKCP